jgi:hypothetical protein
MPSWLLSVAKVQTVTIIGQRMHDNAPDKTVVFRVPPLLASALATAAANDLVSVSDVLRGAVLRDMRERGLMVPARRSEVIDD